MPFVNVLLLTGFLAKTGLENVENVEGIAYNGRKFNVYRNTQATNEIKIHPYLSETMDMIERIFDHNLIEINGVKMNTVEACKVSEIDLGVYTAAAELIVSESEIISTNCCC